MAAESAKFNLEHEQKIKVYSLRLPDVIGPFDDSYRFQKYVTWMQILMEGKHFGKLGYEKKDLDQKLSFVYSKDVAKVILGLSFEKQEVDGSFNLACIEQPTLPEFLSMVAAEVTNQLKVESIVELCLIEDEYCNKFFPSVNCGPILISKA